MRKIICLLVVLMTAIASNASVGGPTFYYRFTAKPSTTGEGKVYASDKKEIPDDSKFMNYYGTVVYSQGSLATVKTVTATAYLFAKPEEGYFFSHWSRLDGDKEVPFSYARYTTDLVTITNTDIQNPKDAVFIAHFAKAGQVYPVSSDETLGTVTIDIPTNTNGDHVTMTAIPDPLCGKFIGWRRNSQTTLTKTNPLTIDVSNSTRGVYTAVFEPKGVEDKGIYILMENVGSQQFFGVTGLSEQTFDTDQRYFKNSMMLIPSTNEHAHSSPAFVLKVTGTPNGTGGLDNVVISSQGISTYMISKQKFSIENFLDDQYFIFASHQGFTGYLKDNGSEETGMSHMELIGDYHHPGIWNRWNYNTNYAWQFRLIDEDHFDENYFGARPYAGTTKDGKYYTTMYTGFPYECRDGVKAYTVDKMLKDGRAHLKLVPNNQVPSNTAVILECNGTTPKENRLMPLTSEPDSIETNLLKGDIWLMDESGDEANYRTLFDSNTMRVLSTDKAVFGKTNYTDYTLDTDESKQPLAYIANNTCYLDVSGMESAADEIEFTTENDPGEFERLKGDVDGNKVVDVVDVMLIVDYILNRPLRVFIFANADTDENNVVDVTDAMWIVNYILHK